LNIFDLSPSEFNNFLAEERQYRTPEEINNLMRQYNDANTLSGRISGLLAPTEGRRRTNILPASVPEGMSLFDALKSGEAQFAVPQGIIDILTSSIRGVENPSLAAQGRIPASNMNTAAMETAGTAMGLGGLFAGKDALTYDPTTARVFAGKRAYGAGYGQRAKIAKAEELFEQGLSNREVYNQTGVFKGVDGKLRFEVDDKSSTVMDAVPGGTTLKLEEYLNHPDLYSLYPSLREMPVTFKNKADMDLGVRGLFSPSEMKITLGIDEPEQMRSTLLHEIQHALQKNEGFSAGSSPFEDYSKFQAKRFADNILSSPQAKNLYYQNQSYNFQINQLRPLYKAQYINKLNNIVQKAFDGRAKPSDIHRLGEWYRYGDRIRSNLGPMPKKPGRDRDNWIASAAAQLRDFDLENMNELDRLEYENLIKQPRYSTEKDINNAVRRFERKLAKYRPGAFEYMKLANRSKEVQNLDAMQAYLRESGEVEARNVQSRLDPNVSEKFPLDTAEFPSNEQIVSSLRAGETLSDVSSILNNSNLTAANASPISGILAQSGVSENQAQRIKDYLRKRGLLD